MSKKKKHKKHENNISNTPETSKMNETDGSTLKNNYMELFPLLNSADSYIQSTLSAIMPVILLVNTGIAFQLLTSEHEQRLELFDAFSSTFIVSLFFYLFAFIVIARARKNIIKSIKYNDIYFEKKFSNIESKYTWFFRWTWFSIGTSFFTFFIGVLRITSPLYQPFQIPLWLQ